ncbi:hypothetical protein J6590_024830 [Homalodisca vitripennis]|nr:hypothetical protein J6590_024830 [Homalodisca vitripennis]
MDNDDVIYSDQTCRYELSPDIDSDDNIDLPVDRPDDHPDDPPIDPPGTDSGGVKDNEIIDFTLKSYIPKLRAALKTTYTEKLYL